MNKLCIFLLGTASAAIAGVAQAPFTGARLTIDFDSSLAGVNEGQFAGGGFQPGPATGQLDSDAWEVFGPSDGDLSFGDTQTSGDFARGSHVGGTGTGGLYAFQVGGTGDAGLGFQAGETDMTPGGITLRLQNATGGVLDQVTVSYEIHVRNDQGRANSLNFSYSTDNVSYISIPALDYTSPEGADATPAWSQLDRQATLTSLAAAAGAYVYLRWSTDDVSGSGSRDEFAIDDITISVPEPEHTVLAATLLLGGVGIVRKWRRRAG